MTPANQAEVASSSQAVALLEKVKILSPDEQADFARMFKIWSKIGDVDAGKDRSPSKPVQWPNFERRLQELFPDGPIPGNPQDTWNEMRRE